MICVKLHLAAPLVKSCNPARPLPVTLAHALPRSTRPILRTMASRSERIVVATSNAPAAVGAYSQAIKANGMVFVSGQVPLDPKTKKVVEGDVSAQAKQSMENIKAILAEAGTSMDRIVKSTILLDDIANFKAVNDVYAEYFPSNPPARAAYAVKALPLGVQVEIECIALAD